MEKFDLSVIIPSYNRADYLVKVLTLLGRQTYPCGRFEVIVADDGSRDGTEDAVKRMQFQAPYSLTYIKQQNAGPASARNKAVKASSAGIVLFTGDDILPKEDLIEEHIKSHRQNEGAAVLGFVDWSTEIEVTDFMRHVAPDGFQFRYGGIKDPNNCGFRYFYTSNISLSKKWLSKDQFDEGFPYGALEDTELAYRLEKKGLRIILNMKAVGYHIHAMTMDSFCRRMRLVGLSAATLLRKHPELKPLFLPVNISIVALGFGILKRLPLVENINRRIYWQIQIASAYVGGLREGLSM